MKSNWIAEGPEMKLRNVLVSVRGSIAVAAVVFLVLASVPQSASALATFELAFSGPGEATSSTLGCEQPPMGPECQPSSIWWYGTVTLVTTGVADGIYTGEDLVSLSIQAYLPIFPLWSPGQNLVNGIPVSPAAVTLLNGKVTGFEFFSTRPAPPFDDGIENISFSGMRASYFQCCAEHGPFIEATAIVTNIPEPEIVSLMLAGLLLTSLIRRPRRSILFFRFHGCSEQGVVRHLNNAAFEETRS